MGVGYTHVTDRYVLRCANRTYRLVTPSVVLRDRAALLCTGATHGQQIHRCAQASAAGAADAQSPDKLLLAADRIRRTAREMFYRDGIRAVGVDAIVTQAG